MTKLKPGRLAAALLAAVLCTAAWHAVAADPVPAIGEGTNDDSSPATPAEGQSPASVSKDIASPAVGTAPSASDALVLEEAKIADSYVRFKNELLKLAELSRASDPAKAELLEKAVKQISTTGTDDQFRSILKLLESDLLRDVDQAVDKQSQVETELNGLLQLLLSENRDRRNASEKERIRGYIKEIDQAIKVQKGIQGQTERSGESKELSNRQGQLAERTQSIAKKIADNEESKRTNGSAKDGEKPGDSNKSGDKSPPKDGDKQERPDKTKPSEDKKPADMGQKPGDDSSKGKPGDGKPSEGQPGGKGKQGKQDSKGGGQDQGGNKPPQKPEGDQPNESENPDEPTNGRKRIEQAVDRMKKAQKRLDDAKRNDAAHEQEEAIAALEKAKAELEEILRQVREEEVEKTLAMLEARFRNMLKLQQAVYDATVLLDKKPAADRNRGDEIEASRLSRREQQIIEEVDKAMLLLREDGSAVALPEAIAQMREDMDLIAQRLNQAKIGAPTQRMELDVIDAIKDLIASFEKAQKDLQQKRGNPQQGQPADPPLVDSIAELKMIRALQVRVNRRTQQYEQMIHSGESPAAEMLPRLRQLAEHEEKIHRIARDLQLGKNE